MTGDKTWKRTQWRTGNSNNLVSEGPEGPIERSRGGSTVLTTSALNTGGKKWTPDTSLDKSEKEGQSQRMTAGNTGREKP